MAKDKFYLRRKRKPTKFAMSRKKISHTCSVKKIVGNILSDIFRNAMDLVEENEFPISEREESATIVLKEISTTQPREDEIMTLDYEEEHENVLNGTSNTSNDMHCSDRPLEDEYDFTWGSIEEFERFVASHTKKLC